MIIERVGAYMDSKHTAKPNSIKTVSQRYDFSAWKDSPDSPGSEVYEGGYDGFRELEAHVNELGYPDFDHRIAHGLDQEHDKESNLQRARTVTTSTRQLKGESARWTKGDSFGYDSSEKHWHRRRGSHDEKPGQVRKFLVEVEETKRLVLEQEDTDGDFQITVHDTGPKTFTLGTASSGGFKKFEIRGTYMLSNLLQELALASDYGRKFIVLDEQRLSENPVNRMSRLIKYHFWDGLTRRIDAQGILASCDDQKDRSSNRQPRIYIPFYDRDAWDYYSELAASDPSLNLDVVRLPEVITPQFVKSINGKFGLLSLALKTKVDSKTNCKVVRGVPFVVPGGRFNEMYGWDSYFETLGLLADGRVELARSMVENFLYELEHYGKILNANRSYYLCRTQPPFLTDMAHKTYLALLQTKKPNYTADSLKPWLSRCLRAMAKELLSVWLASPRLDQIGLSKYYPEGIGMPPETESTHFNHVLAPFAAKHGVDVETFKNLYDSGAVSEPKLDSYFVHDRAVRESGHDTTYRFDGKCAQLVTIDLNSLLYKYAKHLSELIDEHCGGVLSVRVRRGPGDLYYEQLKDWLAIIRERGVGLMIGGDAHVWNSLWAKGIYILDPEESHSESSGEGSLARIVAVDNDFATVQLSSRLFADIAERLKELIYQYLYNPADGLFYDYDVCECEQSVYETVTCLWTLWAGLCSPEQAQRLVHVALPKFEVTGGLVSGTEESRGEVGLDRPSRQWDWPYGWAPHQMLAWVGLSNYGFTADAMRLAYRWLYTIAKSFVDFNGVVPEKFDVVMMSHKVDVEYGNVGTEFRCINREGFGWMNASFELGLSLLNPKLKRYLGALTPPDQAIRPQLPH